MMVGRFVSVYLFGIFICKKMQKKRRFSFINNYSGGSKFYNAYKQG